MSRTGEVGRGDRPRRRRRLLLVLAFFAASAALAVLLLGRYAADLFVVVVREAAHSGGLEIRLGEEPSASLTGFEVRGVTLLDADGTELLLAAAVSGRIEWFPHDPWIGLSLVLRDVQVPWRGAADGGGGNESAGPLVPDVPAQLARVVLERARVQLGDGREVGLDAALRFDGGMSADIGRLDYEEPSGEIVAEKLSGALRLERAATQVDEPGQGGAWNVELALRTGSALLGPVLLDLETHPFSASASIARDADGSLSITGASAALGRLVRGSGRLRWAPDGNVTSADGKLATDELAEAFVTLVREPFSGVFPPLAETSLEGRAELALRLDRPSREAAFATLTLSLPTLRAPGIEAERLDAVLPWSGSAVVGRTARDGRLRAARLSLLGLAWTGVGSPLAATPGRLRTTAAQDWKTDAGSLRLTGLALVDEPAGLRLEAALDRLDLDLARLGAAFGVEGLEGRVTSGPSRLRLDAEALRSDATFVASAFGGRIELSNLFVEHPFRRVPELGLDASLSEVDLASLTSWLGAGRVTGVLEGEVRGLVIADGQPQALDADLHTVERRGVSQYVDVRAIVQLGVLGGGDSGALTGTLLKFVDRYRYSKLGLRCRLRNDVFELRGVETKGGKDYIIKGSLLPPSVSVVSHSQVVSFSEMLRRIQRITAIDEGGTPNAEP